MYRLFKLTILARVLMSVLVVTLIFFNTPHQARACDATCQLILWMLSMAGGAAGGGGGGGAEPPPLPDLNIPSTDINSILNDLNEQNERSTQDLDSLVNQLENRNDTDLDEVVSTSTTATTTQSESTEPEDEEYDSEFDDDEVADTTVSDLPGAVALGLDSSLLVLDTALLTEQQEQIYITAREALLAAEQMFEASRQRAIGTLSDSVEMIDYTTNFSTYRNIYGV
ncbi:MAG: hypothetical protein AAFO91_12285, partial [Bacteroidota bacterium]